MEYIHQLMDSDKLASLFNLPASLKSRMVEVIILPVLERQKPNVKKGSAFGCLRRYANPMLISKEDGAWEQAVIDKYANS